MGPLDVDVLRKTRSCCPTCVEPVPAVVAQIGDCIYQVKTCPRHGEFRVLLSRDPAYFRDLHDFFFDVMPRTTPQRDFIIRLTERCNLNCSICLARANARDANDYPLDKLLEFARQHPGAKLDLMGCEPTVRDDLPDVIRALRKHKCIIAVHTNGIKLADKAYLKALLDAGMGELHLQFDGLDDRYYQDIRSRPLAESKLKVLRNLGEFDVATDLRATICRGYNEGEIPRILETAVKSPFVKETLFLGCRPLGKARGQSHDAGFMPEDMMDLLEEQTGGKISKRRIRQFQKLYFAFLSIFGVRKCFYIQHYLIVRDGKGGYIPIDQILDLDSIERKLEAFRQRRKRIGRLADVACAIALMGEFLKPRPMRLLRDFFMLKLLFAFGMNLTKAPRRAIILGFITACDPFIFDEAIAANCGKGEVCLDHGIQPSGARANVLRERDFTCGSA